MTAVCEEITLLGNWDQDIMCQVEWLGVRCESVADHVVLAHNAYPPRVEEHKDVDCFVCHQCLTAMRKLICGAHGICLILRERPL